jgi:hypothetical protein
MLRAGLLLTILLFAACLFTVSVTGSTATCQPHSSCDPPGTWPTHPELAFVLLLGAVAALIGTLAAAIWRGADND